MRNLTVLFLILFALNLAAQNRERAFEINKKLGRGINFGNMFEAPSENVWGTTWRQNYAKKIAELGFNHIRIPIRWEPAERSLAEFPYTISAAFLNRIKQVVDSTINNGLYAIINMHHHEALYENPEEQKERFLAQWKQISEFFKDYPDFLLFELMNEPHGNLTPEIWNVFAIDALEKIRENNPERIVLLGTAQYGGLGGLPYTEIPDDKYIILTVHYYNPFQFTHQGANWAGEQSNEWLGTKWNDSETEREIVQNEFTPLVQFEKNNIIPIHIGEFGSYNTADMKSRAKWTTYLARYFETLNWSWAYWEFSAGFGIYDPDNNRYKQELVDALLHNEMPEPSRYVGTPVYTSNFQLSTDGWSLQKHSGTAFLTKEDNAIKVNITDAGTETWHLQLMHTNIKLTAGKKYRLSFKAKAETTREATTYVGMNSDPWSSYSGYNGISLADTFTVYTFIFEMQVNDNDARIVFDLGKSMAGFIIKKIVLEEIVLVPPTSSKFTKSYKSTIYPNPTSLRLFINNLDEFEEWSILDMQGSILKKQRLRPFINQVETESLPSGMYFVKLVGEGKKLTTKIIKK